MINDGNYSWESGDEPFIRNPDPSLTNIALMKKKIESIQKTLASLDKRVHTLETKL